MTETSQPVSRGTSRPTVLFAPPTAITAPEERYRKTFKPEHLKELADSILDIGLINPPVCRRSPDSDEWLVVAGERRIRAMKDLVEQGLSFTYLGVEVPPGMIPFSNIETMDELVVREIEWAENAIRLDLPWQERVAAIKHLNNLRKAQNPNYTHDQLHAELYGVESVGGRGATSRALAVAEHLDSPEVQRASSIEEAYNNIRKDHLRFFESRLASISPTPKSPHSAYHGEAIEVLEQIEDGHFDCIMTDPPYGVGADQFKSPRGASHHYDDSPKEWESLMVAFAREAYRLTKDKAHAYVMCDIGKFERLKSIMEAAGFSVWRRPLIWSKGVGNIPDAQLGPQTTYEAILFANKGPRRVTGLYPDVISVPGIYDRSGTMRVHAAQKPVDLYVNLMKRTLMGGWTETVLDPFMGSGTIFPAATKLQVRATGIEVVENAYNIAKQRTGEGL